MEYITKRETQAQATKAKTGILKRDNYLRRRRTEGWKYLEGIHSYKLMGNGEALGGELIMSGREARDFNLDFRETYQCEVGKEIDAKVPFGETKSQLKRWVVLERHVDQQD